MHELTDEEVARRKKIWTYHRQLYAEYMTGELFATIESKNASLRECRAERDEIREENGRIRSKADAMLEAKEKTIVSMQEDIEEMHQRIKELEAENNSLVQRRICPVCGDTLDLVEHRHLRRTHD